MQKTYTFTSDQTRGPDGKKRVDLGRLDFGLLRLKDKNLLLYGPCKKCKKRERREWRVDKGRKKRERKKKKKKRERERKERR